MWVLKYPKKVSYGWMPKTIEAPAGTECVPASNIAAANIVGFGFWIEPFEGLEDNQEAMAWCEVYGFHANDDEVEEINE